MLPIVFLEGSVFKQVVSLYLTHRGDQLDIKPVLVAVRRERGIYFRHFFFIIRKYPAGKMLCMDTLASGVESPVCVTVRINIKTEPHSRCFREIPLVVGVHRRNLKPLHVLRRIERFVTCNAPFAAVVALECERIVPRFKPVLYLAETKRELHIVVAIADKIAALIRKFEITAVISPCYPVIVGYSRFPA